MSESTTQACWRDIGYAGDRSCPRLEEFTHCRNCPVFVSAGHGLLDREPPPGYVEESAAHLAQGKPSQVRTGQSAVVFRLGPEWIGLPTAGLRGVFEERAIRPIPHRSGKLLLGVSVAQGQILPCVSLHGLLGVESAKKEQSLRTFRRFLAVGPPDQEAVILPVDEVHGVVRFNDREMNPPPVTVSRSPASYTKGVLELRDPEARVSILDEELFFSSVDKIIR